jgi:hypothetical protein
MRAAHVSAIFERLRESLLWEIDNPRIGMANKIRHIVEEMELLLPDLPARRHPWEDVLDGLQGELQTLVHDGRQKYPELRHHMNIARSPEVPLLVRTTFHLNERVFVLTLSYRITRDGIGIDVRSELRNETTSETLMRRRSTVSIVTAEELLNATRSVLPHMELHQNVFAA